MPWVVGIDEAGYGPNLGPLVQAVVGFYLTADDPNGWETLHRSVRRVGEPRDDRLLIDDSKKVLHSIHGFTEMERTIRSTVPFQNVGQLISEWNPTELENTIKGEYWYDPDMPLPISQNATTVPMYWPEHPVLSQGAGITLYHNTTSARRFNDILKIHNNKAAVIIDRLISMIRTSLKSGHFPIANNPSRLEPMIVTCDKLGGRNFYGPILQEAFPDGWPVAVVEGAAESRYRIMNVGRDITVSFKPRADGENVCVALASMLAKYVREVCMKQFNAFWAKHVPGIQPTAGYPVDAKRFYAEIRPAMEKLGIEPDAVWRKK